MDILYSEYAVNIYTIIGLYLILSQGFNIVFGLGRLFNLAHISSYAIGAYAATLLTLDAGWSPIPAMLAAVFYSSAFSLLIAVISVRLDSDYFAIGTLAFSSVVSSLLINWRSLTRGVLGIPAIPRPTIFGISFDSNEGLLALVWICALTVLIATFCLMRGSFGRAIRAIGEFEIGAASLGFDAGRLRLLAVMFASGTAGLAGALFSYYLSFIDPTSFSLTEMILVLTIVVVGRPGSFWGCVAATFGLILLPEALRFVELPPDILGPLRQCIYAIVLFIFVCINRARIFPEERTI